MNVNPESERFGDVVPWDSLTDEQKASGDWIELPPVNSEPRRARRKSPIDALFGAARTGRIEDLEGFMRGRVAGAFDAVGKPR